MPQGVAFPEMIFVIGLPGAGKSHWVSENYADYHIIDPDSMKQSDPNFNPRLPGMAHRWSKRQAAQLFVEALRQRSGQWAYVGTGANFSSLLGRITLAKTYGFRVGLVYIQCSLDTALARNAARERAIAEGIIREKARHIEPNFWHAARYVNFIKQINNDDVPVENSPSNRTRITYHQADDFASNAVS
jgi:predicted kinase